MKSDFGEVRAWFANIAGEARNVELCASQLIVFAKTVDLTKPECDEFNRTIASWIEDPNEHLRHAVVFSLCHVRPVPGFEDIAIRGWEQASSGELHWCASAIELSFQRRSQVNLGRVRRVLTRLFGNRPDFQNLTGLDFEAARLDWNIVREQTNRVMFHFQGLLGREAELEDSTRVEIEPFDPREWRIVAEVLWAVTGASPPLDSLSDR